MKGNITPGDKFNKVTSIMDASSLNIELEMDNTPVLLSAELHVLTEIVKALIISGEKFHTDEALVQRARNIAKKIMIEGKKDLQ